MRKFNHRRTRIAAAAATVGAIVTSGVLAAAGTAQATPAHIGEHIVTTNVWLGGMPEGTVMLGRDRFGTVDASVSVLGLTPGSSHTVELVNDDGQEVASFGTLTANGVGQAVATLDSRTRHLADDSRVVILNGTDGGPVSAEPIARTHGIDGFDTYWLVPVEVSASGAHFGVPYGQATVTYDPFAQTISVTVNASGLTPGAHAAHIHVGSCAAQGPVQYMLMDFVANGHGRIVDETRTVTNVTTPLPATGWYLNLHQGNGNNILDAAGNPTINFRPLLCGNIIR